MPAVVTCDHQNNGATSSREREKRKDGCRHSRRHSHLSSLRRYAPSYVPIRCYILDVPLVKSGTKLNEFLFVIEGKGETVGGHW